ncbi:MAG: glycosyltransferase [bacterium]|nr:glycosyltransferase [bacterium]
MRLLVITQKVDAADQVLGFMVDWLRVLATKVESLEVICLERGEFNLPTNVRVHSLGKEASQNRLKYLVNFYRYLWLLRNDYDAVWVHMNQVYVILGWPVWWWQNKKISLWYAHGAVSWSLKLAEKLADVIFTSSSGGFRLTSKKLKVVGQGINTEHFNFKPAEPRQAGLLVSVGRISKVKKQVDLVKSLASLDNKNWRLEFYGAPVTAADQIYDQDLAQTITDLGLKSRVILAGPVSYKDLPARLRRVEVFVTMSQTGSLDKAVLEAMAMGVIPVVLGHNFNSVLGSYQDDLAADNEVDWQAKVEKVLALPIEVKQTWRANLRSQIVDHHSLDNLMNQIVMVLKNV